MSSFKKILASPVHFLYLFPLLLVLHTENLFHHFIKYSFVWKEITLLFLTPWIFLTLYWYLLRSISKAAIGTFSALLIFYFFTSLKVWLDKTHSLFSHFWVLLPILLVLFLLELYILKKRTPSIRVLYYLNTLFFVLVAYELVALFAYSSTTEDLGDHQKKLAASYIPCRNCEKPDIYYILFDGYNSSTSLKARFNFDNKDLDSFLLEKKFRIIPYSRSNYNFTPFSISSCFNLDYLSKIDTVKAYSLVDYLPAVYSVYQNELFMILQKEGYQLHNQSIFDIKGFPSEVPAFDIWDMKDIYKTYNLAQVLYDNISWRFPFLANKNELSEYARKRDGQFEKMKTIFLNTASKKTAEQPRFTYVHFSLPHGPYTYDSSGKKIAPAYYQTLAEKFKAYANQVQFCNGLIQKIIDLLMANKNPSRPLVIILQGDHGYRFNDVTKKELEFENLNAFYFSNGDYSRLYDSISNVNTFRVVFNTFFKQEYPLLKDRSFFLNYK
jgi:hypothetical protein